MKTDVVAIRGYKRKDPNKAPAIVFTDDDTHRSYVVEVSTAVTYTNKGDKYNHNYYNVYSFIATKNSQEITVTTETSNGISKVEKMTVAELKNEINSLQDDTRVLGYALNKSEKTLMYIYKNKDNKQIGVVKKWN